MNKKSSKQMNKSKSPSRYGKLLHKVKEPEPVIIKKKQPLNLNMLHAKMVKNNSKISLSSHKNMAKSRSMQTLPPIPGNDLKMIKHIFEQARRYRAKMAQQIIPVKNLSKNVLTPQKPKAKKSPKLKNSSNSIRSLKPHICKFSFIFAIF